MFLRDSFCRLPSSPELVFSAVRRISIGNILCPVRLIHISNSFLYGLETEPHEKRSFLSRCVSVPRRHTLNSARTTCGFTRDLRILTRLSLSTSLLRSRLWGLRRVFTGRPAFFLLLL
ncbi:hypothetical protein R3I94_006061 [Phoxinus phoxinus]